MLQTFNISDRYFFITHLTQVTIAIFFQNSISICCLVINIAQNTKKIIFYFSLFLIFISFHALYEFFRQKVCVVL